MQLMPAMNSSGGNFATELTPAIAGVTDVYHDIATSFDDQF